MSSAENSPRFDPLAAAQQMHKLQPATPEQASTPAPVPVTATTNPAVRSDEGGTGLLPPSLSDRGNARLFVQTYGDQFRHVEGLGWFVWDGYRWKRTGGEKSALWAAGEMAEAMPESDTRGIFSNRELAIHKRKTLSTAGMKALLAQAKASPDLLGDLPLQL
ncbi:DNA primase, partial [Streptomyces sp. NPDC051133]